MYQQGSQLAQDKGEVRMAKSSIINPGFRSLLYQETIHVHSAGCIHKIDIIHLW